MPKLPATGGSVDIKSQGQTSKSEYGTDPHRKGNYGGESPKDEKLK